jgi:DNA-directed RNA polymerase subunit RPC12/RpoP
MGWWVEYICTRCGFITESKVGEEPYACRECGSTKYLTETTGGED